MPEIIIRSYQKRDREEVRKISGDTANLGRPVETFFSDREVMMDLLMNYYTDYEPATCWVAEYDGKVIGYLTGCVHNKRYLFLTSLYIVPQTLFRAFTRGVFFQEKTWRLLKAVLSTVRRGGYRKDIPIKKYPAHLHINIQAEFRNQHIGQRLIEQFFQRVKTSGQAGIHAVTRQENTGACRFFERMGFTALSRHVLVAPSPEGQQEGHTVVYGKSM